MSGAHRRHRRGPHRGGNTGLFGGGLHIARADLGSDPQKRWERILARRALLCAMNTPIFTSVEQNVMVAVTLEEPDEPA
jgi:hypothetical protein